MEKGNALKTTNSKAINNPNTKVEQRPFFRIRLCYPQKPG